MKKKITKGQQKVQEFIASHYGTIVRYHDQTFRIGGTAHAAGIYCVAAEDGRVPKGESKWFSLNLLRTVLSYKEART